MLVPRWVKVTLRILIMLSLFRLGWATNAIFSRGLAESVTYTTAVLIISLFAFIGLDALQSRS